MIFSEDKNYLLILFEILEFVCSSDDFSGGSGVVIVEVVRDDGAAAHKVIVLVQKKTSPRKLSWSRIRVISAGNRIVGLACSAHLGGVTGGFLTSLGPRNSVGLLRIDAD